jgi:hypothetical protein
MQVKIKIVRGKTMIDITQVIMCLFVGLIMWLALISPVIKANLTAEQWKILQDIVLTAVCAAEQLGATKVIRDKLEYAVNEVEKQLAKYKIVFDKGTIRAAIEAAVLQNFSK